jgi:hypothetical protein
VTGVSPGAGRGAGVTPPMGAGRAPYMSTGIVFLCVRVHVCTRAIVYMCMHACMCACLCVHVCVCARACVCVCLSAQHPTWPRAISYFCVVLSVFVSGFSGSETKTAVSLFWVARLKPWLGWLEPCCIWLTSGTWGWHVSQTYTAIHGGYV